MKKIGRVLRIAVLFVCALGMFLSLPLISNAEDQETLLQEKKTDLIIQFDSNKGENPRPPIKGPVIYEPPSKPTHQLPQTGELLSAFIIILIGLTITVFTAGLLLMRNVYYTYR